MLRESEQLKPPEWPERNMRSEMQKAVSTDCCRKRERERETDRQTERDRERESEKDLLRSLKKFMYIRPSGAINSALTVSGCVSTRTKKPTYHCHRESYYDIV